jgi:stage II sporulation protein M
MKFLTRNYSKCYQFLRESSNFVIISLGIFCAFIILGFAFPIFFQDSIFAWIEKLMLELEGLGTLETIWFIFFNNIKASFFVIVLGVLIGIFPIITAIVNGYLLGFVARNVVESNGILVLWRLLPHGIFELPAIILSMGLGLKLGMNLFSKKGREKFRKDFVEALRFFVFVILPLLIIAGIIEGILIVLSR